MKECYCQKGLFLWCGLLSVATVFCAGRPGDTASFPADLTKDFLTAMHTTGDGVHLSEYAPPALALARLTDEEVESKKDAPPPYSAVDLHALKGYPFVCVPETLRDLSDCQVGIVFMPAGSKATYSAKFDLRDVSYSRIYEDHCGVSVGVHQPWIEHFKDQFLHGFNLKFWAMPHHFTVSTFSLAKIQWSKYKPCQFFSWFLDGFVMSAGRGYACRNVGPFWDEGLHLNAEVFNAIIPDGYAFKWSVVADVEREKPTDGVRKTTRMFFVVPLGGVLCGVLQRCRVRDLRKRSMNSTSVFAEKVREDGWYDLLWWKLGQ